MAIDGSNFARSRLRNLLQSILLVVALVGMAAAIGWFIAGLSGVIWFALAVAAFLLFGQRVSARMVMRLYRAVPLTARDAPDLTAIMQALAERAGLPSTPQLYYLPTPMLNAFAVGNRRKGAIGVTAGLLDLLNLREVTGVLAHEMSHLRHNDTVVMGLADVASRVANIASLIGQVLLIVNLPLALLGEGTLPWLMILLLILAPTVSALMQLALSRTREFDADLEAARLTGDPKGLASALTRMQRVNGGFLERIFIPGRREPEPSLLRTHPTTAERVDRLQRISVTPWRHFPERPAAPRRITRVPVRPRWHYMTGIWR